MPLPPTGDIEAIPRRTNVWHRWLSAILLACVGGTIYTLQRPTNLISSQSQAAQPEAHPEPEAPVKLPTHYHARLLLYLDRNQQEQPVKTAADWQLRRQQILEGMQQVMGPLPERSRLPTPTVRVLDEQDEPRFKRQNILIRIDEHDQVPAYLYLPKNRPEGSRLPAIIALHQTIRHGKKEVDGQGTPDQGYARELANRGYVVIAPDYPSFGDYECDFTDKRFGSGTIRGIYNHMRCVDLLASKPEVDPQRIGAIGHSLGGHNAMFLAAFDQRIAATVSSCGWTPFHDYYNGKLDGWTPIRYMPRIRTAFGMSADRLPFDFYEVVAAFAPRAFLSVSPLHDVNFDVGGVKKGIHAAKQVYQLLGAEAALQARYPDCGHAFPEAERQAAYAFFDQHLNHKSAPDRAAVATELKKLAALEPAEAIKSFTTIPGIQIELLAAEPLLRSPVAMDYDADGRLYVVEMCDYSEQRDERLGSVRRLDDTDGDGRFDRAVVVADGLSWPKAVLAYDGGVFVGAAPDLLFLKDHDGDGRADEKRVVFTGFGRQNVQGLLNSFRWGLDNRIYVATSSNGGLISRPDATHVPPVSIQGRNFSFDPRTLDIRLESSTAQHGLSQDDWGRWFLCSNSDHLSMVMYEDRYAAVNGALLPPSRKSIAADGPQAEIFRTSPVEPWRVVRTRLRMQGLARGPIEKGGLASGYFSGATGVTAYRGDALPDEMRQQVFIADACSNLVHRKSLSPDGVGLVGRRIDERREFLSSSDTWFRPVQMANAPDGSLQILDMYREVIEHPHSLPPEIKPHIDLTSGRDRGRLYRIVPSDFKQPVRSPAKLSTATIEQLVATLEHRNGWHRDTAALLIFTRQDMAAVPLLEKLSADSKLPEGRMHALYALAGLDRLTEATLLNRLQDNHPRVREHAVRLAERFKGSSDTLSHLLKLTDDSDPRVRYQLGFTLGVLPASLAKQQALVRLAQTCGEDPNAQASVLSAVHGDAAQVLQQLLADPKFTASSAGRAMLAKLASLVGASGTPNDMKLVENSLQQLLKQDPPTAISMARGLVLATRQSQTAKRGPSIATLSPALVQRILSASSKVALDDSVPSPARVDAVLSLAIGQFADQQETLLSLLELRHPVDVQRAAIQTLGSFDDKSIGKLLATAWPGLSPQGRTIAAEVMLSREDWIVAVLDAILADELSLRDFDLAKLRLLATRNEPAIRSRYEQLAKHLNIGNRHDVVQRYQPALSLAGNRQNGQRLFEKNCAVCHRVGNTGHEVGPNLAAFKNRGAEALLLNVLDPNREVNPQYVSYTAELVDGRTVSGMVVDESAASVTLRRAENVSDTVARDQLESLRSTQQSLMPEGMEAQLDPQGMADLIAFLLSLD